jgi:Fuc2NAc and GlcNAc transferase
MLLTLFFSTIIISLIITNIIEKNFSRYSLFIDKPNNRSMHSNPVPTAGGIGMLATYILYITALHNIYDVNNNVIFFLFVSLLPIAIVCIIDDFKEINIFVRLLAQFFSALLIIYYFQISDDGNFRNYLNQEFFLIIILSIILSMWLMNLYNFMDGIDGYAVSECIFVSFSSALIIYLNNEDSILSLYLVGLGLSSIGILVRNWHPAKIFMGDTGSVSIGFFFSFFIFYSASESMISIYTWLILLSIFISDSTYTLFVRIVTKKNITQPHLTHAFHLLASNKNSQVFVTKRMIILNIFWVLPMAVLSNFYMNYNVVITFIAYVPMVVYLIKIGAGLEYNKKI